MVAPEAPTTDVTGLADPEDAKLVVLARSAAVGDPVVVRG